MFSAALEEKLAKISLETICRDAEQYFINTADQREFGRKQVEKALPLCESYIERLILPWLVFANYDPLSDGPIAVGAPGDEPDGDGVILIPQLPAGRFRLDFGFVCQWKGAIRTIAFECDGIAFHDRGSDILRDGELAYSGILTHRAFGSQIMRDPRRVVVEVMGFVSRWATAP